ncbi:hypothetical protein [Flavobacterium aquidurense]|jgi:hypothetical protein|uniref:hypothetical protein n=1 Tax=Flavobacterium aquidurense TaxID=362413 RepID=UPI002861A31C|nr:hypothetical protein [Flavobacterium aquidurense]MDR7371725.1 hypothetical protein [Flavobacterium aquidurense]
MKKWKVSRKRIEIAKANMKMISFLAMQEKILPKWRRIAFDLLSDEETILINNSICK